MLVAVWTVYTADHLLDALRSRTPLLTYRHRFHRHHAGALVVALIVAVVVGLAAASALRPQVRLLGIGLGLVVLVYLASAQALLCSSLPKEPVAAVLYAAGIWGGPLLMSGKSVTWPLLAAGFHAFAALMNLVVLGVFETDVDRKQQSRSLALCWGRSRARRWTLGVGAAVAALAVALAQAAPPGERNVFLVLATLVATPPAMLLREGWFGIDERYRIWGDSVFLLCAVPRLIA